MLVFMRKIFLYNYRKHDTDSHNVLFANDNYKAENIRHSAAIFCENCKNDTDGGFIEHCWPTDRPQHTIDGLYCVNCYEQIVEKWIPLILQTFVCLRRELVDDIVWQIFDNFVYEM